MPDNGADAAAWLKGQEDTDRKNARVIDKVMLALPRDLSPEQRVALVRGFAEAVTLGRASWLAAFHENTANANNPHCHLVVRDRDPATRKRVIGMSEKGSTERLREMWEIHANQALREAGHEIRIDRRTLEAQGIAREPTIHEGVRARKIRSDGRQPRSRLRRVRNGPGARRRSREVRYHEIDAGRSRHAYNQQRAVQHESEADLWAAVDHDREVHDVVVHREIQRPDPSETERQRLRAYMARYRQRSSPGSSLHHSRDHEHEPDD